MVLELTLVKTQNQYSPVGTFLERTRYNIENDSDFIAAILKFVSDNISIFNSMISDKAFIDRVTTLKSLTIDEFQCLRYVLTEYNLDIWSWVVAENEVNATSTTEESFEYNIVDETQGMTESLRFCSKILLPSESNLYSSLYSKIYQDFNLFKNSQSPLFEGMNDPYLSLLETVRQIEKPVGAVVPSIINELVQLLQFLGKRIYVINN